jgi:multidrug efflux pump subunit AcrB
MNTLIRWFATNHVATNLLMMLILLAGGYYAWQRIPIEYFPENEPDEVEVSVSYRGAAPEDVETGVVQKIEQALQGLPGIQEIESFSSEGRGNVTIEVQKGKDARQVLDDVKNRIDAINTFSTDTERPVVSLNQRIISAVTVVVSADMNPRDLRRLGEQVRDQILMLPGVTLANLRGIRPFEISIEVSEQELRRFGLTLQDVSQAVRRHSIDVPAGGVKTDAGDVLLRTKGQAYNRDEFENLVVRAEPNGARVLVKDVARVRDGFDEELLYTLYNGKPSIFVRVERTGDQNLLKITDAVKEWLKTAPDSLPSGVSLTLWRDNSKPVKARLSYLLWNGLQGALLVFIALALFLRTSFAFWVVAGIPIAFAGGLVVMHFMGFTINLFSLFGFIVVMGIVTDDAIVVGESVYTRAREGMDPQDAAITGTIDVATPVTFGVLTVVVAFLPLFFMTGRWGRWFEQIPVVVVPVLLASLVESKLILPAHLAKVRWSGDPGRIGRMQQAIANWLERVVVRRLYVPTLNVALRHRYATLAIFLGILSLGYGAWKGGLIKWNPFPPSPGDSITAGLEMGIGTPAEVTEGHMKRILGIAEGLQEKYRDKDTGQSEILNIMATMGSRGDYRGQTGGAGQPHMCEVVLELQPIDDRKVESAVIKEEWRKAVGDVSGARELRFHDSWGRHRAGLEIQVSGQELKDMLAVTQKLQEKAKLLAGVKDVFDDYATGKQEIQVSRVKPEAAARGITPEMIGQQLRQAFFGSEAQRIQRGRDDVRVMVRYPRIERTTLDSLEKMKVRAADGSEIPFLSAAEFHYGRSPTGIRRHNSARTIRVIADVNPQEGDIVAIRSTMSEHITELKREYPGLGFSFEGEAREERETSQTLKYGMMFVLFALYALMAIPFKSYLLPLIILLVIPFGWIGAALGHYIKGLDISFFSVLGMLTLSGVVVNDSLVLVDYVNRCRDEGMAETDAAREAGAKRFRAIFLTNLTAFAGLLPIIFAKNLAEPFLSQMSISIAFGVMFSFTVTLFLVPINYMVLADLKSLFWRRREKTPAMETVPPAEPV